MTGDIELWWVLDADHTPRQVSYPDWKAWAADVSTVFLSVDHQWGEGPPVLFETMIFGGPHADWTDRYSTWDEAVAGHERVVAALTEGREP